MGAWIFVSHSRKDVPSVRRIRDQLEGLGHDPILFFLKCLDESDELHDLICREIRAREWFIVCESLNSRASTWVSREMELIKTTPGKAFQSIDLADDVVNIAQQVRLFASRASVFIDWYGGDEGVREIVPDIATVFAHHDYAVRFPASEGAPRSLRDDYLDALSEVAECGFALLLFSPHSPDLWLRNRLHEIAKSKKAARVTIPILVSATDLQGNSIKVRQELRKVFATAPARDFTLGSLEENVERLIVDLKTWNIDPH